MALDCCWPKGQAGKGAVSKDRGANSQKPCCGSQTWLILCVPLGLGVPMQDTMLVRPALLESLLICHQLLPATPVLEPFPHPVPMPVPRDLKKFC